MTEQASNIIKTPEYGWVKLLPCGVGDEIYRIKYKVLTASRKAQGRGAKTNYFSNEIYERRIRRSEIVKCLVVPIIAAENDYQYIGKHIYLTREEAEKAMDKWLSSLMP